MFSHPYSNQPDTDGWRAVATDITTEIWHAARDRGRTATAALTAGAVTAAATAAWMLWLLVSAVFRGIGAATSWTAAHTADWPGDLWAWTTGPIAHTITDPIHHYLHTHTHGLPINGGQAFVLWLVALGVTWGAATLLDVRAARLGWAVLGALTVAGVYAGTTGGGKPTAAAVTAAVWALASLTVYRWPGARTVTHVHVHPATAGTDD